MVEEFELLPDARRVVEGLRDTGYEFTTAVADIVDNSIAAEATDVRIRIGRTLDEGVEVSIADNGTGMDREGLLFAMKYGSPERPHAKSLGKFGLGLKTASTSMARQLTVLTRWADDSVHEAVWDLDHVAETDRWMVQLPSPTAVDLGLLEEAAESGTGTVVIWRKVDRLVGRQKLTENAIQKQIDLLRSHLALTYVRYLRGEAGQQINIRLNGVPIEPWDPFGIELGSEILLEKSVDVEIDGAPASFTLRSYVLPPRSELTEDELKLARIQTNLQGFYVFREDRVIVPGDWLGMYRDEPHFSLCRIDFSFDHRLDDALQIDIKKSRIRLLAALYDEVRQLVAPSRFEAEERYRKNQRSNLVVEGGGLHQTSNKVIGEKGPGASAVDVQITGDGMAVVANPKGQVKISIPTLSDVHGGPHVVARDDVADGNLWQPGIVDGQHAVLLNVAHPFYERFYKGNAENPMAIQGADYLLWALCEAELFAISDAEKEHMSAVRREVSRLLRELSKELPEPPEG
jgi:hypothetical protein